MSFVAAAEFGAYSLAWDASGAAWRHDFSQHTWVREEEFDYPGEEPALSDEIESAPSIPLPSRVAFTPPEVDEEVEELNRPADELSALRDENAQLRKQIKQFEDDEDLSAYDLGLEDGTKIAERAVDVLGRLLQCDADRNNLPTPEARAQADKEFREILTDERMRQSIN